MNPDIRVVGDDYSSFIFNYFKGQKELPFENNGFNMSFAKLFSDLYIFAIRNAIPYKNIIEKKKLYPGISENTIKTRGGTKNLFNKNDVSEYYIWDWKYIYESTIIFVGNITKDLHIKPYKKIDPISILQPFEYFDYYENDERVYSCTRTVLNDFRLYNFDGKIYLIDSAVTSIKYIYVKNNQIKLIYKTPFSNICGIKVFNNNEKFKVNIQNKNYYKFFQKNWSLYKIDKIDKKETTFYFLHLFGEKGVIGVIYDHINDECHEHLLVKYKRSTNKNIKYGFPTETSQYMFSLGSSCISFAHNELKGYLGVGHLKIKFSDDDELDEISQRFKELYIDILDQYRHIYGKSYRPHFKHYFFFLFLYDEEYKKFYISDMFLPDINNYKYHFSLVFPMAVVNVNNDIILSMGYGDYTNILVKYTKNQVYELLKYDLYDYNIKNLEIQII